MRRVMFQVGYDAPDGYGMSFTKLNEFITYEDAEYYCLNDNHYYVSEMYIRKVYVL
jgi:hypothetical protein